MSFCYIQDDGVQMLHHTLKKLNHDIDITELWLRYNGLTKFCSSAISDIAIRCRVKALNINGNKTVSEDHRLYSIISDPSAVLEVLYMHSTNLSSNAAIKLFTALSEGNKLK